LGWFHCTHPQKNLFLMFAALIKGNRNFGYISFVIKT